VQAAKPTDHHVIAGSCGDVSCLHATRRPVRTSPQQPGEERVDLHMGVKFGCFLMSKEGVDLCANQLVHEYIRYVNFNVKQA